MQYGYQLIAAKPKAPTKAEDQPSREPMRSGKKIRRNPSSDQKKVRRLQTKTATTNFSPGDRVEIQWHSGAWKPAVVLDVRSMGGEEVVEYRTDDGYTSATRSNGDPQPIRRVGSRSPEQTKAAGSRGGSRKVSYTAKEYRELTLVYHYLTGQHALDEHSDVAVATALDELGAVSAARTLAMRAGHSVSHMDVMMAHDRALQEMAKSSSKSASTRKVAWTIEQLREVSASGPTRIDGMLVDAMTADAIVKVHEASNDENKARIEALPLDKAASVAWKLVRISAKAGQFRIEEATNTRTREPIFTAQFAPGPDVPGAGQWQDMCSFATRAEAEDYIERTDTWHEAGVHAGRPWTPRVMASVITDDRPPRKQAARHIGIRWTRENHAPGGEVWPVSISALEGPNYLAVWGSDDDGYWWLVEDREWSDYVGSGMATTLIEAKEAAEAAHYADPAVGGQMSMFGSSPAQ